MREIPGAAAGSRMGSQAGAVPRPRRLRCLADTGLCEVDCRIHP